ncbi:CPBP family intramembrane glutamic endopeptidase [Escherichia coli]|uniref:CPBP family intramembrane glutamic endopeptidase n=1 Tax=Escherichia coli TaxID=562 RepID=UPI00098A0CD1|nr:type II CAAX endopeptidase family protein [Escherichia coli]
MIQTRNQYLQFMLVMLAAWGISWGARFVMEQAVLLYGSGKNYLFFSHGTVLMYLLCVFLVYRRWIAPLPVVGQLRNVGVPWLVGAMAVVYVGVFLLGKALALPAEPFMTKLFADKSIPDVILTLLTIFILAPLNEETLFRGIMLNVFRSRYCWTMWLGALITSLLFVAAHSQYQNLLTLAELGTVAKLAMRQPFVLFKGLTFQKLCLPGAFRPGDHHNKMLRPGLCVVHASPQYL